VLAHRQIKIDDEQQIWVRGATLFRGYVNGASISCPTDAEGWYGTGDLGRWDSQGRLIIIGRRDHLFISGGENIYPEEIERALLDLPGVLQAIVVPAADREFGQIPVAFVDGDHDQVTHWRRALAELLPKFKIPARYYPWPQHEGLKPNRRTLQQLADQDL
jgi:O-succinylbenzoic acid--CoA ligase